MFTFGSERIKYLEDNEVKMAIAKSPKKLMLEFVYYLALRRGEVGLIKRDDVETTGVWVTVLKSGRKTGVRRRYFMPLQGEIKRKILEHKMSHQGEFLFMGYGQRGISGEAVAYAWRQVAPKGYGAHCLRHSRAVRMYQSGYSEVETMAWLRHKSISSTMVYFKATGSRMHKIAAEMAK